MRYRRSTENRKGNRLAACNPAREQLGEGMAECLKGIP